MFENYVQLTTGYKNIEDIELRAADIFLTVYVDDIPFEFLVHRRKEADKAIVFGSGAFDANKLKPPIFNRFKWRYDFDNASTIYYNDPTLYLGKINLSWGYGDEKTHYLEKIADILTVLLKKLSVENNNTLFMGSSGGGFTSMILASMIKGSKAFVNNPQTDIRNYYVKFVRDLYEVVYPGARVAGFSKLIPHRSNVVECFKKQNHVPEIYYAQNLAVKHDVERHMLPFVNELTTLDESIFKNKINMHYYHNKEQGHNPMDKEETLKIINELLESKRESIIL